MTDIKYTIYVTSTAIHYNRVISPVRINEFSIHRENRTDEECINLLIKEATNFLQRRKYNNNEWDNTFKIEKTVLQVKELTKGKL